MEHVAIDLGGRKSQVCIRAANGDIVRETRVATRDLPKLMQQLTPSRVIVETCAEAFFVADAARAMGHDVRVVPATLVKALGVGARGIKTDQRDARALSEASCRVELPSVHISSALSRERKTLCAMREGLVRSRTQMINGVRGWLRAQALSLSAGNTEAFPKRIRKLEVALPSYVERQLVAIESVTTQIRDANRELARLAKSDSICTRLMSVPGVGPMTAIVFVATLDDISRFQGAHQVQSYLGLTPGEHSSSESQRRTGITKAGSTRMRWALVQAAWAARRTAGTHPMVAWSIEVEKRRGKRIAIVALARKMAGILYALWRDGTFYSAEVAPPT